MTGYRWDFASVFFNWQALASGFGATVQLFAVCAVLGLGLGLLVALLRRSSHTPLCWFAIGFIEFFRNTPVLVQILWFFFALPILAPVSISPFWAAVLGISLNSAAHSAEIYRAGIQSIEPAQWEAARALGMSLSQGMRRIILPQAFRRILPALTNRGIEIFKMTTLASVVAYAETISQAKLIASLNFNPLETYLVAAAVFFVFLYPLVLATYALERRLARSDMA
jgi:polar amino acid transport system permease protein